MTYENFGMKQVCDMLSEVGSATFVAMSLLSKLEANEYEAEQGQICECIAMLQDGCLEVRLGAVIALGRMDEDGFVKTYDNAGDIVAEVIGPVLPTRGALPGGGANHLRQQRRLEVVS